MRCSKVRKRIEQEVVEGTEEISVTHSPAVEKVSGRGIVRLGFEHECEEVLTGGKGGNRGSALFFRFPSNIALVVRDAS
jgi:hypothetical protein